MRIRLYMDIYPGFEPQYASAFSNPGYQAPKGSTRIAFDALIPDEIMLRVNKVDNLLPETAVATVVGGSALNVEVGDDSE